MLRALIRRPNSKTVKVTTVLAAIQSYAEELSRNPSAFFPPRCPSCLLGGALSCHELRRRGFWVRVGREVHRVASIVLRVAYNLCTKKATVLPDFALPHKRYVLGEIVETSERYLANEGATYSAAAGVEGMPVFHDADGASRAPSTVRRWITFLGTLVTLLAHGTDLLLEADPMFSPLWEMVAFSSRRYRSEGRRETLDRAWKLLRVRSRLRETLELELFPRFATPCAWR